MSQLRQLISPVTQWNILQKRFVELYTQQPALIRTLLKALTCLLGAFSSYLLYHRIKQQLKFIKSSIGWDSDQAWDDLKYRIECPYTVKVKVDDLSKKRPPGDNSSPFISSDHPLEIDTNRTLMNETMVKVVDDFQSCEDLIASVLDAQPNDEPLVCGFDAEWKPPSKGERTKVSVIQIAFHQVTVVIQLEKMIKMHYNKLKKMDLHNDDVKGDWDMEMVAKCVPPSLSLLLNNQHAFMVGVGVSQDKKKLWNDWQIRVQGCVELVSLIQRVPEDEKLLCRFGESLYGICKAVAGVELVKDPWVRCGNWETNELSMEQVLYAAGDAHFGRQCFVNLFDLRQASPSCRMKWSQSDLSLWCRGIVDSHGMTRKKNPDELKQDTKRAKTSKESKGSKTKKRSQFRRALPSHMQASHEVVVQILHDSLKSSLLAQARERVVKPPNYLLTDTRLIPGGRSIADSLCNPKHVQSWTVGIPKQFLSRETATAHEAKQDDDNDHPLLTRVNSRLCASSRDDHLMLPTNSLELDMNRLCGLPEYAFDNDWRNYWQSERGSAHWLQYTFPFPVQVTAYALRMKASMSCKATSPRSWILQARLTDRDDWTSLHSIDDAPLWTYPSGFENGEVPGEIRYFSIPSSTVSQSRETDNKFHHQETQDAFISWQFLTDYGRKKQRHEERQQWANTDATARKHVTSSQTRKQAWECYSSDSSAILERQYQLFKQYPDRYARVKVPTMVKKKIRNYLVDFTLMEQMNEKTAYHRPIRRIASTALNSNIHPVHDKNQAPCFRQFRWVFKKSSSEKPGGFVVCVAQAELFGVLSDQQKYLLKKLTVPLRPTFATEQSLGDHDTKECQGLRAETPSLADPLQPPRLLDNPIGNDRVTDHRFSTVRTDCYRMYSKSGKMSLEEILNPGALFGLRCEQTGFRAFEPGFQRYKWWHSCNAPKGNHWLEYSFLNPFVLSQYTIQGRNDTHCSSHTPKGWLLFARFSEPLVLRLDRYGKVPSPLCKGGSNSTEALSSVPKIQAARDSEQWKLIHVVADQEWDYRGRKAWRYRFPGHQKSFKVPIHQYHRGDLRGLGFRTYRWVFLHPNLNVNEVLKSMDIKADNLSLFKYRMYNPIDAQSEMTDQILDQLIDRDPSEDKNDWIESSAVYTNGQNCNPSVIPEDGLELELGTADAFVDGVYVQGTVHTGFTCNQCLSYPIIGIRYRCSSCSQYNVCSACFHKRGVQIQTDIKQVNPHNIFLSISEMQIKLVRTGDDGVDVNAQNENTYLLCDQNDRRMSVNTEGECSFINAPEQTNPQQEFLIGLVGDRVIIQNKANHLFLGIRKNKKGKTTSISCTKDTAKAWEQFHLFTAHPDMKSKRDNRDSNAENQQVMLLGAPTIEKSIHLSKIDTLNSITRLDQNGSTVYCLEHKFEAIKSSVSMSSSSKDKDTDNKDNNEMNILTLGAIHLTGHFMVQELHVLLILDKIFKANMRENCTDPEVLEDLKSDVLSYLYT